MCVCKYNICIFIISHKVLGTTPPFQSPTSSSVRSTFLLVDLWIISETMCLLVTNPSNLCSKHSLFNLNFGLLQEGLSGNRVPLNSLVHHPFPIIKWHWKWGVYMYIRYIYIYLHRYIHRYIHDIPNFQTHLKIFSDICWVLDPHICGWTAPGTPWDPWPRTLKRKVFEHLKLSELVQRLGSRPVRNYHVSFL